MARVITGMAAATVAEMPVAISRARRDAIARRLLEDWFGR